jgi:HK97 family phage portal protein
MARWSLPWGGGYAWNTWTDSRYNQVQTYKQWVYISVNAIANKVAQLQPQAAVVRPAELEGNGDLLSGVEDNGDGNGNYSGGPGTLSKRHNLGRRRRSFIYKGLNRRQRRKAMSQIRLADDEDLQPLPAGHPLVKLLRNPNKPDTSGDFFKELIIFLYLTGNAYVWLPRNRIHTPSSPEGLPAEMWVVPSHWIWPVTGDSGEIESYDIRPVYSSTLLTRIPAGDIVHLKFPSPISKIDGWSPQTAGARWIDQHDAIDQSRWHAFANVAQLGPMLLLDENTVDPGPEDIVRIEERFMSRFSGPTKAGRPVILRGVKDIKPYSSTPREMDFNASSDQLRDMILALFGVPRSAAMFAEGMTYGSNIAVLQWFCSFTINPLTKMIGDVFTEKIASRFDEQRRIRVYYEDCTPEDPVQKLAEHEKYIANGAMTLNEVREDLGLEPYEGFGDLPILPMGVSEFAGGDTGVDDFGLPGISGMSGSTGEENGEVSSNGRLSTSEPPAAGSRLSAAFDAPAEGRAPAEGFGNGVVKVPRDW